MDNHEHRTHYAASQGAVNHLIKFKLKGCEEAFLHIHLQKLNNNYHEKKDLRHTNRRPAFG